MCDTDFFKTCLRRLDHAERFYDGPIPPPLRRGIFSPREEPTAETPDAWRQRARDSAARLRRLKPLIGFAGTAADARCIAASAYRRELEWCRECVARWRRARAPLY